MRVSISSFKNMDWENAERVIVKWKGPGDYIILVRQYHTSLLTIWHYINDEELWYMMQHLPHGTEIIFTNLSTKTETLKEYEQRVIEEDERLKHEKEKAEEETQVVTGAD